MKNSTWWSLAALTAAMVSLLYLVVPRQYHVPAMKPVPGMQMVYLPDGTRLAYWIVQTRGPKNPVPVIFLQGGPGGFISQRTLSTYSVLAKDGFDVYLYDQVGSGHSSRLSDIGQYTVDRHIRDLEAVIRMTGAGRVILIGQSWGAMLATQFAALHPEQVDKLVLAGPGPMLPARNEIRKLPVPDTLDLRQPVFSNGQAMKEAYTLRWLMIHRVARTFGIRLASDREADDFQTCLNNGLNRSVVCDPGRALPAEGGGGYYAQVMTVKSFDDVPDRRNLLKNCTVPLLLIRGQCDNQPWGFAAEYLQLFRDHRLVIIPGAGHSASVEQTGEFIRAIRVFLGVTG